MDTVDVTKFEYGEYVIYIDMEDYITAKQYRDAIPCLDKIDANNFIATPEAIENDCNAIKEFYSKFVGAGEAEKLFSKLPLNRAIYMDVLLSLFTFIKRQAVANSMKLLDAFKKYSPHESTD